MPERDRPVSQEVEVTPAMIEAGLAAYGEVAGGDPSYSEHVEGIRAAFRAMSEVRSLSGSSEEQFTDDEAQRRFEAALKGALKTPHTPQKPKKKDAQPRSKGK